jgi:hypothetical protein
MFTPRRLLAVQSSLRTAQAHHYYVAEQLLDH